MCSVPVPVEAPRPFYFLLPGLTGPVRGVGGPTPQMMTPQVGSAAGMCVDTFLVLNSGGGLHLENLSEVCFA